MLFGALSAVSLVAGSILVELNGVVVAIVGLLLAFPDLIYWAVTRLNLVPDNIPLRVSTGYLLGIGIMIFGQASIGTGVKLAVPIVIILIMVWADRKIAPAV